MPWAVIRQSKVDTWQKERNSHVFLTQKEGEAWRLNKTKHGSLSPAEKWSYTVPAIYVSNACFHKWFKKPDVYAYDNDFYLYIGPCPG
jgi:hypothetical protein